MNNNSKYMIKEMDDMEKGVCLNCAKYDQCDVRKTFGTVTYCDLRRGHFFRTIKDLLKKYLGGGK